MKNILLIIAAILLCDLGIKTLDSYFPTTEQTDQNDARHIFKNGELIYPDGVTSFDTLCVMDCDSLNYGLKTCDNSDSGIMNVLYIFCCIN